MNKCYTIDELDQLADAEERDLEKLVVWKDGWLTLCGYYDIEESRIRTHTHLISWIRHLCEKNWMTPPMIERMISLWGARWNIQTQGVFGLSKNNNLTKGDK